MLKRKVRFLKKASPRVVNGPTSSGRTRPEPGPNPARTRSRPEKPGPTYNSASPSWRLKEMQGNQKFLRNNDQYK